MLVFKILNGQGLCSISGWVRDLSQTGLNPNTAISPWETLAKLLPLLDMSFSPSLEVGRKVPIY